MAQKPGAALAIATFMLALAVSVEASRTGVTGLISSTAT